MEKDSKFKATKLGAKHQNVVLEALHGVNRELIICASTDIAEEIACECDKARPHIIDAIWLLTPFSLLRPVEELPVHEFKAAAREGGKRFEALFDPLLGNRNQGLNGEENGK
jgi:hypothetical protein